MIDLPGHDGYGADTYGESFADVYDDWYADVSDVDATVATIARLAGDGPVLELGVGTGRLAIPLAAAGVRVVGVDASPSMLRLLADKPGADAVTVVLADMAHLAEGPGAEEIAAAGPYTVAFAAFNTFFNLATPDDQRRCLEGVFDLLVPGGVLVIEGFVPPEDGMTAAVSPCATSPPTPPCSPSPNTTPMHRSSEGITSRCEPTGTGCGRGSSAT